VAEARADAAEMDPLLDPDGGDAEAPADVPCAVVELWVPGPEWLPEEREGATSEDVGVDWCPEEAETDEVDTDGVDTDGTETEGVETEGTVTEGVETAGVETDGVEADGVDTEGTVTEGVETDWVFTDGTDTEGVEADAEDTMLSPRKMRAISAPAPHGRHSIRRIALRSVESGPRLIEDQTPEQRPRSRLRFCPGNISASCTLENE
jgi:hypothetical protein